MICFTQYPQCILSTPMFSSVYDQATESCEGLKFNDFLYKVHDVQHLYSISTCHRIVKNSGEWNYYYSERNRNQQKDIKHKNMISCRSLHLYHLM